MVSSGSSASAEHGPFLSLIVEIKEKEIDRETLNGTE